MTCWAWPRAPAPGCCASRTACMIAAVVAGAAGGVEASLDECRDFDWIVVVVFRSGIPRGRPVAGSRSGAARHCSASAAAARESVEWCGASSATSEGNESAWRVRRIRTPLVWCVVKHLRRNTSCWCSIHTHASMRLALSAALEVPSGAPADPRARLGRQSCDTPPPPTADAQIATNMRSSWTRQT
jgi:hypothetical protein